jgi:NADH-quinone oxidoreductase subunit N
VTAALAPLASLAQGAGGTGPLRVSVDPVALAPEIILTATLCAVLLLDLAVAEDRKWLAMPLSAVGVLATLASVLALAQGGPRTTFGGMFVVDDFALLFKGLFCVSTFLVLLVSHDYLKRDRIHQGEYYFLMLAALLGMLTIASSRDLIAIFVSIELISAPAFVLAGLRKGDVKSNEAALKFFLFGVLSTAVMLFGMSLIFGITGTTDLAGIAAKLAGGTAPVRSLAILSIFFVIVGFAFKISAFPFQWWVPDTYEGSPVPVASFLSVASKTGGFVGLLQIMFIAFLPLADVWRPFLAIVAVLTMTFGNIVALQQRHIVRLLAYSSVAQAGYMILPFGVVSATDAGINHDAFLGVVVYLLIYAFMETGAFAAVIAYGRQGGGYFLTDYDGLSRRSFGLAISMAVFLLSLAGIPFFAGWAAKLFVFRAVVGGGGAGLWLGAAMAINTVIGLFYYAAVVRRMFFAPPSDDLTGAIVAPTAVRAAMALSVVMVVVVGILPELFAHIAGISTLT